MPSPEAPLAGSCACGTVHFLVTAPLVSAGYCHCHRCQRRSGAAWTLNGLVPTSGFELTAGAGAVTVWEVPGGFAKAFCSTCGGHVYAGDPAGEGVMVVRLGALDGDPGIRPRWHQWVESAPDWEPLPDDGLPRYPQKRDAD
jgi:hypothetical protein